MRLSLISGATRAVRTRATDGRAACGRVREAKPCASPGSWEHSVSVVGGRYYWAKPSPILESMLSKRVCASLQKTCRAPPFAEKNFDTWKNEPPPAAASAAADGAPLPKLADGSELETLARVETLPRPVFAREVSVCSSCGGAERRDERRREARVGDGGGEWRPDRGGLARRVPVRQRRGQQGGRAEGVGGVGQRRGDGAGRAFTFGSPNKVASSWSSSRLSRIFSISTR